MHRDFWHERWDEGRIGFHQDQVNPYLVRYWSGLGIPIGATVFVPLCGKSRDMLWLRDQGYAVVGVEIVPRAVEAFFAENALTVKSRPHGAFTVWEGERIKILQGDFFDLTPEDVAGIAAVYDRASLIALPPAMRQRYAAHLGGILPGNMKILLVTMDYPQEQMDGPPFAVTEQEVAALYQENFEVKMLCNEDILSITPRFQQQGLSRLLEKVYVLRAH
ncbi:MAG: thiopurine S-methyltransferase [Gammaproteobacteria bacterium]|jgi:thiopurine S-methyltransferase